MEETLENPQEGNPVLCSLPFSQLRNAPGLNYQPCCWAKTESICGPQNTSPIEYFKSKIFNQIRKDMLAGNMSPEIKSMCKICLRNEKEIGKSTRTQIKHEWSVLRNFDVDGKMVDTDDRFLKLELNAFGNYCNLECYECQPDNSSRRIERLKKMDPIWRGLVQRISFAHKDVKKSNPDQWKLFVDDLVCHGKNIKTLAFCGGEPMTMVSHFDILDALIETDQAKNIELMYVTNFTLFNLKKMKKYIDAFKWVSVNWSVDGLGERNHWLRYPTKWDTTLKNVLDVRDYFYNSKENKYFKRKRLFSYIKNKNSQDHVKREWKLGKIEVTITPSLLGIYKLKETVEFMRKMNLYTDTTTMVNKIDSPKFCQTRHLPDKIKEEIGDDIKSISQYVYDDMMQPRDQHSFELGIKYFDALDKSRGTNWRTIFPEIACYL